jgi:hypothetical protein
MVSNELVVGGLLALNVALYASLAFLALRSRRRKFAPSSLSEAFSDLELALEEAVPDLPSGFTWEEAVARLKSSGLRTEAVEGALKGYEAYRYGGAPLPDLDYRWVAEVANALGGSSAAAAVRRGGGANIGH